MKNTQIIALIVGVSILTFILSVVFSINMVSISPQNLAKVIKKDPATFMNAIKESSEAYQKKVAEKAMEDSLKNPVKIPTKGRVTFGNESAPITIVEYSDFQCPYCQRAALSLRQIKVQYKDKVKLVYKHMPLSFHALAKPAAEYYEAVAIISHEKARQFHDSIFDNFQDYASLKNKNKINKSLNALVKKIGLDIKAVKNNMKKAKEIVARDELEARKFNVKGTPTFFVNGVKTRDLETMINRFLEELE